MNLSGALDALRRGELIGIPTDTVYGVAADPWQEGAVESLFVAKGRPGVKPIPILGASVADLRRVAVIDDRALDRAAPHWPGGLTLVLPRVDDAPAWVGDAEMGTVAVRIPDHPLALEMLRAAGPLAVTSANRSGRPAATDADEARLELGDAVAVYLPGRGSGGAASTVVDLTGPTPLVLRPGAVEWGSS